MATAKFIVLVSLLCIFKAAISCSYLQPPIIGSSRTCSIVNKSVAIGHVPEVHIAWYEDKCGRFTHYGEVCPGHVGMRLTLQCPLGGYVCRGSRCYDNTTRSAIIHNLQPEDAGEYVCRTDDYIQLAYNVTVEAGVAIGVDTAFCGLAFFYDTTYKCCRNRNLVMVETSDVPRWFYAFGTDEVTIQHRWLTSARDHYPSDLGLVPDRNFNSSHPYFRIDITNFPTTIDKELQVLVNISAADNFTSQSLCVQLGFPNLVPIIYANQTLPLNTTISEGDTATFECEMGTYRPKNIMNQQFTFQLHRPSENGSSSELVWNATCYNIGYETCENVANDQHYRFNYTILQNLAAFLSVRYTLQILNVTERLNKSSFSCSIISENQIQWQHTADLTVTTTAPSPTAPYSKFPLKAVVTSCVLVSLVIVCGLVVTMGTLLARKRWKRRAVHVALPIEPDQVPLTEQSDSDYDSEPNTPVTKNGPIVGLH